jgi:hypothetical protein
VRINWKRIAVVALWLVTAAGARAQEGVLTPAQSAAKAKQIIQQAIDALGGQAYLNVRDQTCEGRVALFGHNNQLINYQKVYDYNLFPDKERTEYSEKRNIIDVYNGKQGWSLDRGGITDMSPDAVADYLKGLKRDINNLFRFQMKEPGLDYEYGGRDVVDLKEVDWVEVTNPEHLTIRIAVSRLTHLPVRADYISRDPDTHARTIETEMFSNYQKVEDIETAFQDTRTRNGNNVFQLFVSICHYNTGLKPEFFTHQSLEERWNQLGGNKKKKKHFF